MQEKKIEQMESSIKPTVFATMNGDGSADFTIAVDGENFKFSASENKNNAVVSYEETLSHRFKIRVSEPRNEVWKMLMTSDEMTEYLELNDLNGVKRNR